MMLSPGRYSLLRVILAVVVGTCLVPLWATAQASGSITWKSGLCLPALPVSITTSGNVQPSGCYRITLVL